LTARRIAHETRLKILRRQEGDLSDDPSAKEPKPIGEETMIHRSESVLTAAVEQELVMMDIRSGRYVGLDDIASVIWRRLETPCTFGQLIDSLVADYNAERAVIAVDVRALLTDMAAHGVVRFD
jgi:hypothetical protein